MELREALGQITEIRQQMARNQVFHGYRSLTVGSVGLMGIVAEIAQPYLVPSPSNDLKSYLTLWISVAAAALLLIALGSWQRVRRAGSPMVRQSASLAAEQFLPSVAIGSLATLGIYLGAPEAGWLLPGLWSLVYSLGVFASYRQLPGQGFWVGAYFALCGFGCLYWGSGAHAFSPWQMGVSFGGGHLLAATSLLRTRLLQTRERTDES